MPLIELMAPAAVTDDHALRERLITTLLRHRGVPDTPAARDNVWVVTTTVAEPRVIVRCSVVAGGMDDDAKAALVAEATDAVRDILPEARVWVLAVDVADGSWGAEGVVTRLADAQRTLGADPSA